MNGKIIFFNLIIKENNFMTAVEENFLDNIQVYIIKEHMGKLSLFETKKFNH